MMPNTTVLMFIMGFQGGTVHQCAKHLNTTTDDILNATSERMEDLMREAQVFRRKNDPLGYAAKMAVDLLEDMYSMEIAEPEAMEAIREALGMTKERAKL